MPDAGPRRPKALPAQPAVRQLKVSARAGSSAGVSGSDLAYTLVCSTNQYHVCLRHALQTSSPACAACCLPAEPAHIEISVSKCPASNCPASKACLHVHVGGGLLYA